MYRACECIGDGEPEKRCGEVSAEEPRETGTKALARTRPLNLADDLRHIF